MSALIRTKKVVAIKMAMIDQLLPRRVDVKRIAGIFCVLDERLKMGASSFGGRGQYGERCTDITTSKMTRYINGPPGTLRLLFFAGPLGPRPLGPNLYLTRDLRL